MIIKFKNTIVDFSKPKIMGVLNVTPDSFYDGGRFADKQAILRQTEKMLGEGADFIDIGGCSTRPGAQEISVEEELMRVIPAIRVVVKKFPNCLVSIDTFRARVAKEAVTAGAVLINDISAGDGDEKMFDAVRELKVPYIIMHKQGNPRTMQIAPSYGDVVKEIKSYLRVKIKKLRALGVRGIIVDPGFGFGKTVEHNFEILKRLGEFKTLGAPVMIGMSRKSSIQKALGCGAEEALNGTTAANAIALMNGVSMLRVHDVKEAKEAIKIYNLTRQ